MPPEQAIGAVSAIDRRSDVFGLGAILSVILTGHPPFVSTSAETTRVKAAQGDVTDCFAKLDGCGADPELVALCKRCLSPKPDDRPADAESVATAVAAFRVASDERARQAELAGVKAAERRKRRRTQFVLAAVAVGLLVAVGVGYTLATLWRSAERAKGEAETAHGEVEAARERLARVEYGRTIQVAYQAWRDNDVGATLALLEGTRPDLRGWEWHYVHSLCNEDLFTIRPRVGVVSRFEPGVVSPDSSRVAIHQEDNTVGVWDLSNGAQLLTLKGHTSGIVAVQYSEDGTRILTDGMDDTARIWDAKTGTELHTLNRKSSKDRASTFSPDGSRVLTLGADKVAKVWDANTGKEVFTLQNHTDVLVVPSFSRDSTRVIAGVDGQLARMWDTKTGAELVTLKGLPIGEDEPANPEFQGFLFTGFSPDGSLIAMSGNSKQAVSVWDAKTGAKRFTFPGALVTLHDSWSRFHFSPDGTTLLTHSQKDSTIKLWDVRTGVEVGRLPDRSNSVYNARFLADGATLLTVDFNGIMSVWNVKTGAELHTLRGHVGGVATTALSPDGTRILSGGQDGTVRLWDVKSGTAIRVFHGHTEEVYHLSFSSDGTKAISGTFGIFKVWDTRVESPDVELPKNFVAAWFPADWTKYLTRDGGETSIFDTKMRTKLCTLKGHQEDVFHAAFNRDGSRVVTGGTDKALRIWDTRTGMELRTISGLESPVHRVALSPNGLAIVGKSFEGEKSVKVWNADSGGVLHTLSHPDVVDSIEFSFDGARIVTWCRDGRGRIWDANTGVELLTLRGQLEWGYVGFCRDGSRIVASGGDKTVRLWDAHSGEELIVFRGHARIPFSAELSPDGTRVISLGNEGTVKLWDAKSGIELLSIPGQGDQASRASFSEDGKRILRVGTKKAVIWDSRPYRESYTPPPPREVVPPPRRVK